MLSVQCCTCIRLRPQTDVFSIFYSTLTLNFDLSSSKSEVFIAVLKCIVAAGLVKFSRCSVNNVRDARTRTHTRTNRQET